MQCTAVAYRKILYTYQSFHILYTHTHIYTYTHTYTDIQVLMLIEKNRQTERDRHRQTVTFNRLRLTDRNIYRPTLEQAFPGSEAIFLPTPPPPQSNATHIHIMSFMYIHKQQQPHNRSDLRCCSN